MTRAQLADRRIAEAEVNLANAQFAGTRVRVDCALAMEALDSTLTKAAAIARVSVVVLDQIGDSFEESVERMQRDLAGKG
jgi:hypothetical protein